MPSEIINKLCNLKSRIILLENVVAGGGTGGGTGTGGTGGTGPSITSLPVSMPATVSGSGSKIGDTIVFTDGIAVWNGTSWAKSPFGSGGKVSVNAGDIPSTLPASGNAGDVRIYDDGIIVWNEGINNWDGVFFPIGSGYFDPPVNWDGLVGGESDAYFNLNAASNGNYNSGEINYGAFSLINPKSSTGAVITVPGANINTPYESSYGNDGKFWLMYTEQAAKLRWPANAAEFADDQHVVVISERPSGTPGVVYVRGGSGGSVYIAYTPEDTDQLLGIAIRDDRSLGITTYHSYVAPLTDPTHRNIGLFDGDKAYSIGDIARSADDSVFMFIANYGGDGSRINPYDRESALDGSPLGRVAIWIGGDVRYGEDFDPARFYQGGSVAKSIVDNNMYISIYDVVPGNPEPSVSAAWKQINI